MINKNNNNKKRKETKNRERERKREGGKVIFGFKRPIAPTPQLLPAHVFDTKARVSQPGDRRRFVVTFDAQGD